MRHLDEAFLPGHTKAALLKEKPFVINIARDSVVFETKEQDDRITKNYTLADFYRVWKQLNLNTDAICEKVVTEHYQKRPVPGLYAINLNRGTIASDPKEILKELAKQFRRSILC